MGNSSLCLKFMLALSLSLSISSSSSSSSSFLFRQTTFSSSDSSSITKIPKASAADLLSLLGTKEQASKINSKESSQLKSCLKFLVPFTPNSYEKHSIRRKGIFDNDRRSTVEILFDQNRSVQKENELIWWPPAPVLELARLAMDSGGDPGAIHRTLDPTVLPVPDVEGSKKERCELTRTPYGRRFINEELNSYLAFLFQLIAARGPAVGLNVSLSRYDFFHGHLFIATDSRRLGILFHAKEYPAYEKNVFPYNMGYCQRGTNVAYDDMMNLRNILWLAPLPGNATKAWEAPGVLVVLDARPGGIIYKDLIPEYVNYARTIYEEDFGDVVVDVNYLNVGDKVADHRIFIC
ncbi:hypothetical protein AQUCO_01700195v1 [Aquilegia coerulea]|uniref:Uncharacterized protein n=1 Tax=Aquilegia coerulea TaxID=218851 RepID=A0A2G5DLP5_AQUCA|nr:hypothetical protein AQUCO_01700195v1 [Aquilegia coerulea]PIA44430.1 hypothetical protein AQUCO_01700195v1 [Aquilegia coerulea]PIA44431.1 hypothetical protein AQUCO_01700195v1 [Aquilegia coerulea]